MGKLVGGPFGQLSGKTGDLVGASWKGISTIKRYQPNVANPQTAGQVAQRGKMANIVAFSQSILSTVIKPLWDRFQSGMSGYNAFVSRNIDLFAAELPSNFAALVISSGKMAPTAINSVVIDASDGKATLAWTDDSGQGFKLGTDFAYVVVVNATKSTVEGGVLEDRRENSGGFLPLGLSYTAGDACHVYLSFLRADGSVVSNNSYLAAVAQA